MKIRRALLVVGLGLAGGLAFLVAFWPSCVAAGTLVDTPSGPRPIESLAPGDLVRGGRVVRVIPGWSLSLLEITTSAGARLRATDAHWIATPGGWTPSGGLKVGDVLRDGATLVSLSRELGVFRVYDLEIDPSASFTAGGILVHNKTSVRFSNERNASTALKTIAAAERDFRENDRDNNKIQDYWVGDVATLGGLLERSLVEADAAPLKTSTTTPKAGYVFATIPERADGAPLAVAGRSGVPGTHSLDAFAFCAWPAAYGGSGRNTFIMSQDGLVWKKDTGRGARVLRWPKDPAAEGWQRLD